MVIIEDRGKQYKLKVGDVLKLPKISDKKPKDKLQFAEIVYYKNEKGEILIGSPYVKDIVVEATVLSQIKDKKIIVFKKKRRHNYRRKIGHRQELTLVKIENIFSSTEKKKPKSTKKAEEISKKSLDTKGEKNGS
ncbi:MAG: 50S ribosomal protein L21 [Alphaproteobacteria bacterium]